MPSTSFPTKESLLEAVLRGQLERLAEDARGLAEDDDPGAAFFTFFTRVVSQATTKRAVSEALADAGIDAQKTTREISRELRAALATLLQRAQRAGAIRTDISETEVMILLSGASHAAGRSRKGATQAKTLEVLFDGLRPR
jgi:AcrR family transcriptional regulator